MFVAEIYCKAAKLCRMYFDAPIKKKTKSDTLEIFSYILDLIGHDTPEN